MINAPSGGAPEKAPRWDLMGTEGCGGGNRVLAPYMMFPGYMGIYRRKKYVGGATVGERTNFKKILRTRKIMVMYSNERPTRVEGAPPYLVASSVIS